MSDPTPAVTNAAGSDAAPSLDPAQPATRCSGHKRKQPELQDGVGDWTEALKLGVCGYSAEPLDDADAPNVVQCRKEGCETKWYHLGCLQLGSVPSNWIREACLSAKEPPSKCPRGGR
ncbi:hypothetical protein B0H10DRAFT_1963623 [Mycena sp. CBHHK59/15]|nr:hypothetical protein B0H10DRAFT_1963623 [Mycena sp. CBHHK59/15]